MPAVAALTSHYTVLKKKETGLKNTEQSVVIRYFLVWKRAGWKVSKSPATMFVWAKVPEGWTSRQFAFELIEKAGLAVVPGDAFGEQGEGYVRMAIVQPSEN